MKNETNTQHTPKYILILVTTREEYDGGCMIHRVTQIIEKTENWQLAYAECVDDVKELGEMPEGYKPTPELLKENEQLKERLQYSEYFKIQALNAELLEALKDVAASKSIMMKQANSEIELKEILATFERVKSSIAKAEAKNLPVS